MENSQKVLQRTKQLKDKVEKYENLKNTRDDALMMIELAVYGLVSGLMYNTFKFNKKKMGTYISLLTAMLCGRIVYAISLFVAVNLMGIQCGGPIAAVTATVSGVPGIIIQVLIIPPVVYALERSGYIDRHFRICKGTVA